MNLFQWTFPVWVIADASRLATVPDPLPAMTPGLVYRSVALDPAERQKVSPIFTDLDAAEAYLYATGPERHLARPGLRLARLEDRRELCQFFSWQLSLGVTLVAVDLLPRQSRCRMIDLRSIAIRTA